MSPTHTFKLSTIALSISLSLPVLAGTVRNDINYQQFRDFAENKGKFVVGAQNIPIYTTEGALAGTMFSQVGMPNLNVLTTNGVATLINPQYIASVTHNRGYGDVSFGYANNLPAYKYRIVDRNNFSEEIKKSSDDFHMPRLNKLVTEVEPSAVNYINNTGAAYYDSSRFSAYVRVGAGTQYTEDNNQNKTQVSGAYSYLTGGSISDFSNTYTTEGIIYTTKNLYLNNNPMVVLPEGGDSGSPLFAYDTQQKRWGLIGLLRGVSSQTYFYVIMKPDFMQSQINEDFVTAHNGRANQMLTWTPQGKSSTITGAGGQIQVDLKNTDTSADTDRALLSLNHGKTVKFTGQPGILSLTNNINQGAGALEFHTNYTVKATNENTTWLGAGVIVENGKTVNWQIKNPQEDRLSKLGTGTLNVNGSGINLGDISVGDGKVILAQTANSKGEKQAFNKVEIVSGRPIVVLNDSEQIKPDNLSFGYKGGRLDLNGNAMTFSAINNQDDGARIVNHHTNKTANLIFKGHNNVRAATSEEMSKLLTWGYWGNKGADIYEYINTHAKNRTDYFVLKPDGNPSTYYPSNQASNEHWEYLGSDKSEAVRKVFANRMAESLTWGKWGQKEADIYEYTNTHANNRTDYFRLKENGNPTTYYLTNQTSNEHWEFLSSDKTEAMQKVIEHQALSEINWGVWRKSGGDIYEYVNTHARNRTDYFALKGTPSAYYPTNQTSNEHWEYLGSDKNAVIQAYLAKKYAQKNYFTFDGYLGETDTKYRNGKLNFSYIPYNPNSYFSLTGGSALNGVFHVDNGTVILSGRPVPYAYDVLNNKEVVVDTDWVNRHFSATTFMVKNTGELHFGRNAVSATGNFEARNNSKIHLGFMPNVTPICQRSDYTGITSCEVKNVSDEVFNSIPYLQANGNVKLFDNATLHLGKANLQGAVQANKNSQMALSSFANWHMTNSSTLGNLSLEAGSNVYLNGTNNDGKTYNELTINGNLTGQGRFHFLTNAFAEKGDHITVNGLASGRFSLAINNTGSEPNTTSPLSLLKLNNARQSDNNLSVTLNGGYVDLGTYRYILANRNNDYRLYSPLREAELSNKQENSQIQAEIAQAESEANKFNAEVERLNAELNNKLAEQTKAEADLANAQKQVQAQQQYVNRFFVRIRPNVLKRERQKLVNLQEQVKQYQALSQQISEAITQLNKTIEDVSAKQGEISNTLLSANHRQMEDILKQAEALCLQNNSQELCNAVITELTAENELEDVSITQREGISRYANTALSELSAQVNNLLQVGRNNDREMLTYRTEPFSVWSNTDYQRTQYGSENYRDFRQTSTLTQLGVEAEVAQPLRLGAIFSHINSSNDFDQANGNSKLKMATLYAKAQSENGWIATLEAGYGKSKNRLTIDGNENKFNRHIRMVGVSLAKRWEHNGWQAQPYIASKYYRLSGVNYELDGAMISVKPLNFITYQAGLKVAKRIELGEVTLTPSFSTEYVDAGRKALKANAIEVNGNALEQRFARHFKHELGLNAQFKNWEVSTHLGLLKGNEMKKQRYAGLKVAYNW